MTTDSNFSPRRRLWAVAAAVAAVCAVGGTVLGLQSTHAQEPAASTGALPPATHV